MKKENRWLFVCFANYNYINYETNINVKKNKFRNIKKSKKRN